MMNFLRLFLLGCMTVLAYNLHAQCNKDYQLYWSDEFELDAVDTNKWVPQQGGGGFGNQEIEYYQPQNASVSDGLLHIKMASDTVIDGSDTYNYTSAKLQTASKVNFQYGKIEASIRMPNAVGSWPAFWMLGSNIGDVGWPHCGEIDIMEWVGRGPNAATGSIFFDGIWPNNHLSTPYNIPQGQSFITDFHLFGIEWEPNEIRYYCDGNLYATYQNSSIAPKEWVFNHEFFLILNCAVGGTGGGSLIDFVSPQFMDVDYVRVYSLPATADSITLSGPKSMMVNSQNVLYKTSYFPNTTYEWSIPEGANIVDGLGTNSIHVNFSTEGGFVKVKATDSCSTLSDSLLVKLQEDYCMIMYDNFDDTINVSFSTTGTLTEKFANPLPNSVNSSDSVGKYVRNILEIYDVFGVNDIALENALDYENGSKVFYLDVLTGAPVGTQITLQLENSSLNAGAYPQGRRSNYIGTISKQNEWQTIQFHFNQIIDTSTAPDQVDHIAILFDPGTNTGDTYYIDNFKRINSSASCGFIVSGIKEKEDESLISLFPNPVIDVLNVTTKNDSQTYSIYNCLGEKVIEASGNSVNVSQLSKGVYLFKTEKYSLKFVKE